MKRSGKTLGNLLGQLSVSSNGSNWVKHDRYRCGEAVLTPFSILERIELGETLSGRSPGAGSTRLSVSSNGSNWVKLRLSSVLRPVYLFFQYPRTDRIG